MNSIRMFSNPTLAGHDTLKGHVTAKHQVYAGRFFLYQQTNGKFVWSVDGQTIALEETDTMEHVRRTVESILGKTR